MIRRGHGLRGHLRLVRASELFVARAEEALAAEPDQERHHERRTRPEQQLRGSAALAGRRRLPLQQRAPPPRQAERGGELEEHHDHHRNAELVEERNVVVEEAVERRVAAERDQDRETGQRDRPHARRAEQQERGNRERHRDHAHVGVGIVGEGHAAPVGRPAEARPAGHHDRGQLPGTERPGGGVLHSHAAVRATAADRVLGVVAERKVVDPRDAEGDRHGSEHRDGARPARRGRRWRAGVRGGQQRGDHHVETHREPRIEGDLRVPAQHLEASGQRQPAEMMESAASHPARRQPEQQRNVRRPHQLAAVAVRADGDQIRREEKGDAAEQRPLRPRAVLAGEQIEEEPAEEVIEQEPRHLG